MFVDVAIAPSTLTITERGVNIVASRSLECVALHSQILPILGIVSI